MLTLKILFLTHLGTPSNTTVVATEGDTLMLDDNVPQVLVSLADVHALDGLGGLTGVLLTIHKALATSQGHH